MVVDMAVGFVYHDGSKWPREHHLRGRGQTPDGRHLTMAKSTTQGQAPQTLDEWLRADRESGRWAERTRRSVEILEQAGLAADPVTRALRATAKRMA